MYPYHNTIKKRIKNGELIGYNAWQDDRNFQYNSWNDGRTYWAGRADAAQGQVNWEKEYNQTENWNKKNYELQKKIYKGK